MPPKEELIASSTTPVAFLLFGARCFPGGIFWTVLPTVQLGTSEDKYVILRKSYPIGNPLRGRRSLLVVLNLCIRTLWGTYQVSWISDVYMTIHNGNKIIVMKWQ